MADPVLHIKDAYFFEVPRFLARKDYQSLDEVPAFLRHFHPEIKDLDVWNEALTGKVIIPQPFGTLANLYEPASGFCISKFMVLETVVAILLIAVMSIAAKRLQAHGRPKGVLSNLTEASALFIRDGIARPAIDSHGHGDDHGHGYHHHDGDRYVPLLGTLFVFILGCNLMGMLPWMGSPTGAWGTTAALACVTFGTVLMSGLGKFGPVWLWKGFVPSMDLPLPLAIILKPVIFVIEVMGMLIKHSILSIRLLANMVAGHIVLVSIMGMIVGAAHLATGTWGAVATISVLGSAALSLLELLVCFLQAYIFTFLSALFIGSARHEH